MMELEMGIYPVRRLRFGPVARLDGDTLTIEPTALRAELMQDRRVKECGVELMHPGEAVRAIHIIDVMEPRIKPETGTYFAGLTAGFPGLGSGRTNVLRGSAIAVSCSVPNAEEGIIDMNGPAGAISKFAQTANVVVVLTLDPGLTAEDASLVAMNAGLKAAVHVARASIDVEPTSVERYVWGAPVPGLPKVGFIYYLYSHGPARERFLFGQSTQGLLPTVVHPNDILDGAIVQNGPTMPSKSCTYNHMNCGVLHQLYLRHNRDIAITGVVVVNHHFRFVDKARSAALAARTARFSLGCDAVIVAKDGGGQADVDLAEVADRCHELGMPTVLVAKEDGGQAGAGAYPLAVVSKYADAIVSMGNGNEIIEIHNQVDRVIGGTTLYDGTPADSPSLTLSYNAVVGAVDFEGDILTTTLVV